MESSDIAKVFLGIIKILDIWKCADKDKSIILSPDAIEGMVKIQDDDEK